MIRTRTVPQTWEALLGAAPHVDRRHPLYLRLHQRYLDAQGSSMAEDRDFFFSIVDLLEQSGGLAHLCQAPERQWLPHWVNAFTFDEMQEVLAAQGDAFAVAFHDLMLRSFMSGDDFWESSENFVDAFQFFYEAWKRTETSTPSTARDDSVATAVRVIHSRLAALELAPHDAAFWKAARAFHFESNRFSVRLIQEHDAAVAACVATLRDGLRQAS